MLNQGRQEEIRNLAAKVNSTSEMYQLIHAMFAIEKMFRDDSNRRYKADINQVWERLNQADISADEKATLVQQAKALKENANKKINILVDYIPQIQENSARITWTQNNTFMIVLPKSMERTRDTNGNINFEVLKTLRKLMAHELGHVVLHSGIFDPHGGEHNVHKQIEVNDISEEEADLFATELITLRRDRNEEIYKDGHYRDI